MNDGKNVSSIRDSGAMTLVDGLFVKRLNDTYEVRLFDMLGRWVWLRE